MFENLTSRLEATLKRLRGEARLSEANISDTLREVRMALLEADVALPVVKAFIDDVRAKAVGQEVLASLTPGQAVIKVVYDALVALMGEKNEHLDLVGTTAGGGADGRPARAPARPRVPPSWRVTCANARRNRCCW